MTTDIALATAALASLRTPDTGARLDAIKTILDQLVADLAASDKAVGELNASLAPRSESLKFEQEQVAGARAQRDDALAKLTDIKRVLRIAAGLDPA